MLRGGVGATGGAAGAGRRAPPRGLGRRPVPPSSRVGGFPARVRRGVPATSPSGRRAELCVSRCPQGRWGCVARRLGCEGEMLGRRGGPVVGRLPARPAGVRGKAVGCPAGASGAALGLSGRRAELSFPGACTASGGRGEACWLARARRPPARPAEGPSGAWPVPARAPACAARRVGRSVYPSSRRYIRARVGYKGLAERLPASRRYTVGFVGKLWDCR